MSTRTAELILRLTDRTSGPARGIVTQLHRLNSALNGLDPVTGRPTRTGSGFLVNELNRLDNAVRRVGTGLSIPATALSVWGAKTVYEMEDIINEIEGRTFGKNSTIKIQSGVELDRPTFRRSLIEQVDILNKDSPLNGKQILSGWNQLVQAGLNYDQIRGVMPAALDFSIAANLDPNLAVDQATNIATAMKLPMRTQEEAEATMRKVADTISYAANITNADVAQMAESFKYAAPAAAALGVDTDQLAAMFVVMARAGIKASEAGVAVRSMLVRMVRPTKMGVAVLSGYGIDFADYLDRAEELTSDDILSVLASVGVNAASAGEQIADIMTKNLEPQDLRMQLTNAVIGALGGGSAVDKDLISEAINDALFSKVEKLDIERLIADMQAAGIATGDFFRIFDVRQGARTLRLFAENVSDWRSKIVEGAPGFSQALADTRMQGIVGAVNRFEAAMVELFQASAESGVLDAATKGISGLAQLITDIAALDPKYIEYGTYAVGLLAVMGPLGLALSGLGGLFVILTSPIRMLTGALTGLATLLLGSGAVAQAAAGGGVAAAVTGTSLAAMLLRATGVAGAVGAVMNPTGVNAGEDDWLNSEEGKRQMAFYGNRRSSYRGPTRRGRPGWRKQAGPAMAAPEPELEGMDLLIKMLDLSGRALWQEFTGNAKASEAGQKAGADVGQGVQTGIAGQVPGVVGQMVQLLNAMQAAVGSGVKVPVTVYGPIDIPNPMAAEGSNTGPAIFKPSSSAAPAPLARRETAMVQHNTFNMNGGDPKANARETGRILDAQLQRSRGLSMDGRPEYG